MSASSTRTATSARNDVIAMLKEDHKRVKKAFREFEKLNPQEDAQACEAIVRQTCAELKVHATLEEEVFYPAARQSIEDVDLIDEAEVEHATAKDLIEQLSSMSVNDDKFAAKFRVLGEYINHHVREEEGEMFPEFTRAKTDWAALCDEMHSRRAELEEEFLPNGQSAQSKQAGKETNSDDDEDIDRPAHVASQPTVSRGSRSAKPHQ